MRGHSHLEKTQKKLYLAVKKELAPFELKKSKELAGYERVFRASLPQKIRASDRTILFQAITHAAVVLVGDFHPFRQSQKGFLRLLEGAAPLFPRVMIALECFQLTHQGAIDQFLGGLITAEELRDTVDFDRFWPFSWESYREILLFARQHRLPVVGLNVRARAGKASLLRTRDTVAAECIAEALRARPDFTVFALYGELHLARRHLPAKLRAALDRRARVISVHQNDIELYWRAPTLADGQKPEVLRLGESEFCVLNSVPWVKLRSYLDWLEGSPSPEIDSDEIDVPGLVHHYARLIADIAGIPTLPGDSVEILGPDRLDSRKLPASFRALRSPDRELAAHALRFHRTGYLPRRRAILLPTVSTNAMAEAATYLLRENESAKHWSTDQWICHFLIGYFGSKLLNPKRKCNEVGDLSRIASVQRDARAAVAARALSLLKPYLERKSSFPRKRPLRGPAEIEACRLAGYVLGQRLFLTLLRKPSLHRQIAGYLRQACARPLLRDIAAKIAKAPVSAATKRERF